MFSIIGAILIAGYTTLSISSGVDSVNTASNSNLKMENSAAIAFEDNPVLSSIVEYVDKMNESSGTFEFDHISKFESKTLNNNQVEVNVRYRYKAIEGNPQGRKESKYEQRLFLLEKEGEEFKVIEMGEYNSAKFSLL